jgi:hypothetical protein
MASHKGGALSGGCGVLRHLLPSGVNPAILAIRISRPEVAPHYFLDWVAVSRLTIPTQILHDLECTE